MDSWKDQWEKLQRRERVQWVATPKRAAYLSIFVISIAALATVLAVRVNSESPEIMPVWRIAGITLFALLLLWNIWKDHL